MFVLIMLFILWFNFVLGLNFVFLCFKLIIIHYHNPKQRKIALNPRIILNHNIFSLSNSNSAALTNLNKKAKTK